MSKKKKKDGLDFESMDKDKDTLNEIIDTVHHTHVKAITAGVELLRDKKSRRIQYSKLKDNPDFQKKYGNVIADEYKRALKENDNIDLKDKFKISAVTKALYGINREDILAHVAEKGQDMTHRYYLEKVAPKLSENVDTRLRPIIYREITKPEHVKQVVEHIGASEHINHKLMTPEEARMLLLQYHAAGLFSPKVHIPPNAIYKKKKKKGKKKKK